MPRNPHPHPHAFTLIELLVVISIIAILIGLLLPALSAAKAAAVQVHCSAQIRNVAQGLDMYASDFREAYPMAGNSIDFGPEHWQSPANGGQGEGWRPDHGVFMPSWMEQMYDYVGQSEDILSGCHAYPVETPYHYFLGARAAYLEHGTFASLNRAKLRYSSAYVLGGDNNLQFDDETNGRYDADKDDYTQECLVFPDHQGDVVSGQGWRTWWPQHNGALNVMFADGHVSVIKAFDDTGMTYRYNAMSAW